MDPMLKMSTLVEIILKGEVTSGTKDDPRGTGADFLQALLRAVETKPEHLVLRCGELTYLASDGVRHILTTLKLAGRCNIYFIGLNENIKDVLEDSAILRDSRVHLQDEFARQPVKA